MQEEKLYPMRYTKYVFDKYNEMIKSKKLMHEYNLWKDGRSYITGLKMITAYQPYIKMGDQFIINFKYKINQNTVREGNVFFMNLNNIQRERYLLTSLKIYGEIDEENVIIREYNLKIKALLDWKEFIIFDIKKFGEITKVVNNIHVENNCYGSMCLISSASLPVLPAKLVVELVVKVVKVVEIDTLIYKCDKCGFSNLRL